MFVKGTKKQNPKVKTAIEYHRSGRLEQALAIYQQALLSEPDNADIYYLLAVLNNQLQEFDNAHRYLYMAISINVRNEAFYCALSDT